ncbi:hypothetical protein WMO79_01110 [Micrococcaceae bacterium Sec7.4]
MSKPFTVIGYWDGNRPVSVGVVEGEHAVHAGHGATEEGDWAMSVEAERPEDAESLAVEEMRATLVDHDDDEEGEL